MTDAPSVLTTNAVDAALRSIRILLVSADIERLTRRLNESISQIFPAATVTDKVETPNGVKVPASLDPRTGLLVEAFAVALAEKLTAAQKKYGFQSHWADAGWQGDLIVQLLDHVRKGDPLDVAAYCAFAWRHGWSIAPVVPVVSGAEQVRAQAERLTFEDELAEARALRSRRQGRVQDWAFRCFGLTAASDPRHRGLRMLEEAIELFQAVDGDAGQAHALVDHVFARPRGEPVQELGGLGVTVLALAAALGFDADVAEQDEVTRLLALDPAHFRDRDAAKAAAGFGAPGAATGAA